MMKTHLLLSALFLTLLFPATVIAATLTGVVKSVVPPYLLVRTAIGHEVVRIVEGGGLGNTDSLGHLKSGRERVEVEWSEERNRIKIASSITRLPVYTVYPAIEVPIEQAATWQNLESGPDKHLMIDVRPTSEWEEGHILRSLSAPFEIPSGSYVPYPADRHGKIILYGGHSQERLVHRAAQKTIVTGYDNVRVYSGGVEDWSRHGKPLGITAAGAKRRIERKEPLLVVDIRDKDAWLAGHISGSISAPAGSFSHTLLTVPNMNNPYPVLLVGSSVQEGLVVFSFENWGRNYNAPVYILEEGYNSWKNAGYPVATGGVSATAADLLPPGEIGVDEFRDIWNANKGSSSAILLNVRDQDDPASAGQLHIPLHDLEGSIDKIPRDHEVVVYCYTGTRAGIAYHVLKNNGFRVRFFNRTVRVGENGNLLN